MNQNHLHLNVNITNAPGFSSSEQTRIESRLSGNEFSTYEQNSSKRIDSSKNSDNSKVKLKRNNIMYTPLTINGAFSKDHNKPPKLKQRFKTKSGDLSTASLATCENKTKKT